MLPGHDIARQILDGIRTFEIDTSVYKNDRAITYHDNGVLWAIGPDLDVHLWQIREFINMNPNEIIVLEYSDYDGDKEVTGQTTIIRLRAHLEGKILERIDSNVP